jgi:hypothetical protein
LKELAEMRRARQERLEGMDIEVRPDGQVILLPKPGGCNGGRNGGNGQDD